MNLIGTQNEPIEAPQQLPNDQYAADFDPTNFLSLTCSGIRVGTPQRN